MKAIVEGKETREELTALKAWQGDQMLACGGNPEKYKAWQFVFYDLEWIGNPDATERWRFGHRMQDKLRGAFEKCDANFFFNVANFIKRRSPRSILAAWVVHMHKPIAGGKRPRYTAPELLNSFERLKTYYSGRLQIIAPTRRHLDRLMAKFGYLYRNSPEP